MEFDFVTQLAERVRDGAAPAVVGLDPRPEALPRSLAPSRTATDRFMAFYRETLPRLTLHVPAVKPNIAYFERFGAAGFACYEEVCALAKELGLLVIGDVKRGDIAASAAAYAEIHLRLAHAVTLHPWLGRDAVEPFLEHCRERGSGIFVLVHTSNPSAAEIQGLRAGRGRLFEEVAAAVCRWGAGLGDQRGYGPVGAVVGATHPESIAGLRRAMPRSWLLLPGVGPQGGRIEHLSAAFDAEGSGALVAQSRGVMQSFAPEDPDWRDRIEQAAAEFARRVLEVSRR